MTSIVYTNSLGETYDEVAIPAQALITFVDNVSERIQHQIITECGGEIIEYYSLLDSYLVRTDSNKEMDFINKARAYEEVEDVCLNTVMDPMSIDMHIIDFFSEKSINDENKNVCMSHGEYCAYAATTAYPDCPKCLVLKSYGKKTMNNRLMKRYLNDVFENSEEDELILINMSFGNKLGKRERQQWDDSDSTERDNWILGYIQFIRDLSNSLLKLSKHNPNFIVFKASGNEGCHIMDEVIFNNLPNKLKWNQHKIILDHVLFVSAKDDDFRGIEEYPIDKTKLYAYYANSPSKYCPYMTMVDISHLYVPGTSFSAPYLLGIVARMFDKYGYKSMDNIGGRGYNVKEMLDKVRKSTREYAQSIQQPGLYEAYYYNRNYRFTGILRSDQSELCESGIPDKFMYIGVSPIDINVSGDSGLEEPLYSVTKLQICGLDLRDKVGSKITISGDLKYNIAGRKSHTDAFLENVKVLEVEENLNFNKGSGIGSNSNDPGMKTLLEVLYEKD